MLFSNPSETVASGLLAVGGAAVLAIAQRRRSANPATANNKATGRRWRGLPVPFFFQESTAEAFNAMTTRPDDVFMSSLTKGGTTWVHKILHSLLHGYDEAGNKLPPVGIGATSQVYPDAITLRRGGACDPLTAPQADEMRRKFFGEWGFEDDMLGQPSPRLISTHMYGAALPAALTAADGQGRLVIVLRNLKDTLCSLHFFRGEPKDGWTGNEHGPGSLARFLDADSPNAYGSCFEMIRQSERTLEALAPSGRCLIVYYEDLIRSLPTQIERLAAFLQVPCPTAKLDAIVEAVTFSSMQKQGGMATMLLRKGGIGDWRNHLDAPSWAAFDAAFDAALEGSSLAEPLRYHQLSPVDGLPPARAEHSTTDDPRQWPSFVRKTLVDGRVVRDTLIATKGVGGAAGFVRPSSEFTATVAPPGTAGATHVAEAGRYHLFVSGVCPWASSARVARHLLGLESIISMDVADGQSGGGWVFLGGVGCEPWAGRAGPFFLHEAYQAADPQATTRLTVPLLWDTKLQTIVSNDSWSIVKMLATAFAPLGKPPAPIALYPSNLASEIESTHRRLYDELLNGVYKAGIGLLKGNKPAAAEAAAAVYAQLGALETALGTKRFLMGKALTAVDIRLTMTLLRFDASYLRGFGLGDGRGGILVGATPDAAPGYPNIGGYVRDVFALIEPTVDWPAFRQYYRWAPALPRHAPLPDLEQIIAAAKSKPSGRAKL